MLIAGIIASHHYHDENGVDENITIQADSDPSNQHLQYRAFDIVNNATQAYKINNLSIAPSSAGNSDAVLKLCNIDSDTGCLPDFNSTCLPNNILQQGESCKLWVHAIEGTANLGPLTKYLTISVQNTAVPAFIKQQKFEITYSKDLYVGGNFITAGETSANYIAKWNGTSWNALGTPTNNGVNYFLKALTIGPDGDLYAGGEFTKASGTSANYIAKWNGTSWNALGTPTNNGMNSTVNALISSLDNALYAGGLFNSAGGNIANFVAKWKNRLWSALVTSTNNGTGDDVNALTIDPDGYLYAGGKFTTAGGTSANYIAKWNGSEWSVLGTPTNGTNLPVLALTTGPGGDLYAGGEFTTAGGTSANHIAKWDGTWSTLGSGINGNVTVLLIASSIQSVQ